MNDKEVEMITDKVKSATESLSNILSQGLCEVTVPCYEAEASQNSEEQSFEKTNEEKDNNINKDDMQR